MPHSLTESDVSRRRVLKAGAAATATAAVASTPAAAHHEGSVVGADSDEGFFNGAEIVAEDGRMATFGAYQEGLLARYRRRVLGYDDTEAAEIAVDLEDEFNPVSADYVDWINERDLGGADREVLRLTLVQNDDEVRQFLVAEFDEDAGEYTSAELMSEEHFDEEHPDREDDERAVLSGPAAANAPDELAEFYDRFVEPDEDPTGSYAARMWGEYGSTRYVTSTLLGDDL